MEKLIVDADGKITIPPPFWRDAGFGPRRVSLVEAAEGLLVYQSGSTRRPRSGGVAFGQRAGVCA